MSSIGGDAMNLWRISTEVGAIPVGQTKKYVKLHSADGYEMGFGLGGKYESHSHLFFLDLIFSPGGIQWLDPESGSADAQLLVVPPRTQVPSVETDDFFFLKFCPDPVELHLPDKVDQVLSEGALSSYSKAAMLLFPWYARSHEQELSIKIELLSRTLKVSFAGGEAVVIRE